MSHVHNLCRILSPLGVYQMDAPVQRGELEALGQALDQMEARLNLIQREGCLVTARSWGLENMASLFHRRPVATRPSLLREALIALLRISGDSFTCSALNQTLSGCGVHAQVREVDQPGVVEVSFPGVPGIPAGFPEMKKIIEDILPAHLDITYVYWYLLWRMLEDKLPSWEVLESHQLSWTELESYLDPEEDEFPDPH